VKYIQRKLPLGSPNEDRILQKWFLTVKLRNDENLNLCKCVQEEKVRGISRMMSVRLNTQPVGK
jgi:hypothetical protein